MHCLMMRGTRSVGNFNFWLNRRTSKEIPKVPTPSPFKKKLRISAELMDLASVGSSALLFFRKKVLLGDLLGSAGRGETGAVALFSDFKLPLMTTRPSCP